MHEPIHVYTVAAKQNLPCCTFVAMWLLEYAGHAPPRPHIINSWYAVAPSMWERLNVWDDSDVWSLIPAAMDLVGGYVVHAPVTGFWHVVQRWNSDRSKGHAFLVYAHYDGTFQVVQSSIREGFRNDRVSSWAAGGYEHKLLVVP